MSAGLTCNYDLDHSFILQTDASTAIPYFFLRSNLSHFDAILQFILQLPALAYSFLGHPYISTIFVGPVGSMISPLFKHNSLCDAQLRPEWRQRFAIASDRPTPTVQFQRVPSPHFKRKIILLSRLLSRFLSIFFSSTTQLCQYFASFSLIALLCHRSVSSFIIVSRIAILPVIDKRNYIQQYLPSYVRGPPLDPDFYPSPARPCEYPALSTSPSKLSSIRRTG